MTIRGGFNVYPRENEDVLCSHPAIQEAAVIGVLHSRHGEEVKALLVLKPGQSATEGEIVSYCRENLAAYKCPRIVEFRDSLPKTATGKVLKRELRDEAAAAAVRGDRSASLRLLGHRQWPAGAKSVSPSSRRSVLPPRTHTRFPRNHPPSWK